MGIDRVTYRELGEPDEVLRLSVEAKTLGVVDTYNVYLNGDVCEDLEFVGSECKDLTILQVAAAVAGEGLLSITVSDISGKERASVELAVGKDGDAKERARVELRAKIAEAVSLPPGSLRISLPSGDLLMDANPDTPLSHLLGPHEAQRRDQALRQARASASDEAPRF